jgi:hypothetical protein
LGQKNFEPAIKERIVNVWRYIATNASLDKLDKALASPAISLTEVIPVNSISLSTFLHYPFFLLVCCKMYVSINQTRNNKFSFQYDGLNSIIGYIILEGKISEILSLLIIMV